ncbi:hypothetical protein FRB99_006977 [Tulasnella sp. 403]|nr:hypothetical protein FRB99_006977 [Tulasnella sp. 403]
MSLTVQTVVLEPSDQYPLFVTAKRYTSPKTVSSESNGITLIMTHATGMHKECWEPVLEALFDSCPGIVEAWSIDAPNHGHAAVLNYHSLLTKFTDIFGWDEYGRALANFLSAGPTRGACVDFASRNLVGLGHSMGAVSMVWLQSTPFPIRFGALILVEPMLNAPGQNIANQVNHFYALTYQRRDVWPSRKAALKDFSSSKGYKSWHPSIISLFVQHAIRDHPAKNFSFGSYDGVSLACDRFHEAACYRGGSELSVTMVGALTNISHTIPVHVIWGEIEDSLSRAAKDALNDESNSNIRFASVSWVPNAGHLVIQNSPSGVATAIQKVIHPPVSAKL